MSIFALAARHANENDERFKYLGKGAQFLAKAKELLLREMAEGKPKIPTIQGFLILGGRRSTVGRSSEGRLYTRITINDDRCRAASGYAEACGIRSINSSRR
jgi:hypothetical protein